jgi:UAA transporter family
VLVGNFRKAGTIALSFVVFPKPFSWLYVWGSIFVFGGLTITGARIRARIHKPQ